MFPSTSIFHIQYLLIWTVFADVDSIFLICDIILLTEMSDTLCRISKYTRIHSIVCIFFCKENYCIIYETCINLIKNKTDVRVSSLLSYD